MCQLEIIFNYYQAIWSVLRFVNLIDTGCTKVDEFSVDTKQS